MTRRLDVALFRSETDLLRAAERIAAGGTEIVDVHSPHPVHGIDEIVGIRRTRLPAATLAAGICGCALGTWLQVWSSAHDWPVNVGGKPWDSMPAFLPVTFEMTVLFAGLATVAALLVRCRLAPSGTAKRVLAGVTDDRYAIVVARRAGDRTPAATDSLWRSLGAESWSTVEEDR